MKILTWNINGIRSASQELKNLLDSLDADIICLQETKVTRDLLDEDIAILNGYNAYFSYSRKKNGYSGVAIYCRDPIRPLRAEEGLSGYLTSRSEKDRVDAVGHYGELSEMSVPEQQELDCEGRAVITQFRLQNEDVDKKEFLCVINVYCPNAPSDREDRKSFKLRFCQALQLRAEALLKAGMHVVIVGDLNTSHRPLDTCDPASLGPIWPTNPLRLWLNSLLCDAGENPSESQKFIDAFRHLHPEREKAFTCWMSATMARQNNYGCRIDYILVDLLLGKATLKSCDICPSIFGSDHCPVKADLDLVILPSLKLPALCTRNMPKFFGRQQKLSAFFKKEVSQTTSVEEAKHASENSAVTQVIDVGNSQSIKRLCLTEVAVGTAKIKNSRAQSKGTLSSGQTSLRSFFKSHSTAMDTQKCDSKVISAYEGNAEPREEISGKILAASSQSSAGSSMTNLSQTMSEEDMEAASAWKNLLRGPDPAPLCKGHREPCVLKTVNRSGPNRGKRFYMCSKPAGFKGDPNTRCDTFIWFGSLGKTTKRTADEAMP